MAMHCRLQLHAIFLVACLAFHASSCEQDDYWQMKLPKLPMPQAIKDNLFHPNDQMSSTKTWLEGGIKEIQEKESMKQPYTVFYWKYKADDVADKANEESRNFIIDTKKASMKQPYTVFSWKYKADDAAKINEESEKFIIDTKKASMKQPYTVFSWKYKADDAADKVKEESKKFIMDAKKTSMKQPYTVFSWKYKADDVADKVNEESEIFIKDTKKESMKQPYTVFYWKYKADDVADKANEESRNFIIDKKKESIKQPYTVGSWKYKVDDAADKINEESEKFIMDTKKASMKQQNTILSWKYKEDEAADKVKEESKMDTKKESLKQPYTVGSWKYKAYDAAIDTNVKKAGIKQQHLMHQNVNSKDDQENEDDLSSGSVFFVEKSLRLGMKLKHDFQEKPKASFMPKLIAQTIPFSEDKFTEILGLFSVKRESEEAIAVKETLDICLQRPKAKKENRTCAQSMEDIVDFVVGELGTNDVELRMMNDNIEVPMGIQDYVITNVKKLVVPDNTGVACHRMSYPYVVYYCHHQEDIGQYNVTLVSLTSGTAFQTTAVCHYDTYAWQPDVLALRYLGIRPGDAPVCHFSALNDMFWSLKANSKVLDMVQ